MTEQADNNNGGDTLMPVLETALRAHQNGEIATAENAYQQILSVEPEHADALHLLGVINHQKGKLQVALSYIKKALVVRPNVPMYWGNLGNVFKTLSRCDEAKRCYEEALRLDSHFVDAYINMGTVYVVQNKMDEAESCFRKALELRPESTEASYNLAVVLLEKKDYARSVVAFKAVIAESPRHLQAHYHLISALIAIQEFVGAASYIKAAIPLRPDAVGKINEFSILLQNEGQLDKAQEIYENLLLSNPDSLEVLCNLATLLQRQGRNDKAIFLYQRAIALDSRMSAAHYNLANTFQVIGNTASAIRHYRIALEINPEWPDARNNLGNVLRSIGLLAEAEHEFQCALSLSPNSADLLNNLGNVYKLQGKLDAAIDSYHKSVSIDPNHQEAWSNLLFALSTSPECSPQVYRQTAEQWGELAIAKMTPYSCWENASPTSARKLKVGFVSGDLKSHPVGYFLLGVVQALDKERFDLYAYSARAEEDELTNLLKPYFAKWQAIANATDAEAAAHIYQDGVDILIDLSGHTAHNRMMVFARKPAPVQISWLGYFASTGLPTMDYVLTDPVSVPVEFQSDFTEQIRYLPETRLSMSKPLHCPDVTELPARRNGYVTYGCFQALSKFNDQVLTAWSSILQKQPMARLRIQNKQLNCAETRRHLVERFKQQGVDANRLSLHGSVNRFQYFECYSEIDVVLDTFPYPGGTTTCEALWMGVPTITIFGQTMLARQGASIMAAAGYPEFVVDSLAQYVDHAIQHANQLERLSEMRRGMRENVSRTALFDQARFTKHFEEVLLSIWAEHCKPAIDQPTSEDVRKG